MSLEVGSIIVNLWGYDQTDADFYRVESIGKKLLTLAPMSSVVKESAPLSMTGHARANAVKHGVAPIRLGYKVDDGGDLTVNFKHGISRIWDGQPVAVSWSG